MKIKDTKGLRLEDGRRWFVTGTVSGARCVYLRLDDTGSVWNSRSG